ncbi:ABC transporter ATP-binding protein [Desulfocurvibacter africanus]|uniref:ABC transporter ATP-binding protein n=1 Tax=Desulfocurvibacter africanus TaxID=873 RepID=UPI002FD8F2B7
MRVSRSASQVLRELLPYITSGERKRAFFLLGLSVLMATSELGITGLVALLAATFSSPESVLQKLPTEWFPAGADVLLHDPRMLIIAILCAILGAICFRSILALVHQWQLSSFAEGTANHLRSQLITLYLQAPYLWVQRQGTSAILFRLNASALLGNVLTTSLNIVSSLLMALTIMCGLLMASPLPSLVFFTILCLGGMFIINFTRKGIDIRSQAVFDSQRDLHGLEQKAVHGLREMRLYGREQWLIGAYARSLDGQLAAKKKQQLWARIPSASLEALGFATLLFVLLFLVLVQDASLVRISAIMGFLAAAAWRCLPLGNRLVDSFTILRSNMPYMVQVLNVLREKHELSEYLLPLKEASESRVSFRNDLRLHDIHYSYENDGQEALSGISFSLKPGLMFGLVGLSGAGKSTLVNILTGFLSPTQGSITVDGVALTRDNLRSWLNKIGYVSQSPYLLDATLAENIALSRYGEEIDRDRVLHCCRMAALDFVDDLSDGIDTMLGERGTRLSGGQAQRVAIARALYSEPELIIFDEATSALDAKNESAILETILGLRHKVTMVIIAHRLSTVENCDAIIWLENGGIHLMGKANEVLPKYSVRLELAGKSIAQ